MEISQYRFRNHNPPPDSGPLARWTDRWTKPELEKLLREIGHAINANNGRCGRIEDTLIKAQSLVLDCLNVIDPIP